MCQRRVIFSFELNIMEDNRTDKSYNKKGERLMKPQVSIVVPVYKTEKYLAKCLDSLVNQTLKTLKLSS
ncbi:hypothetical protein FACS1894202_12260 [Clostridia bacterium]|nr:hypothetical protein FACS1894202_12260 [Clostridia bacterium]